MPPGGSHEGGGDAAPRWMAAANRIRLTGRLAPFPFRTITAMEQHAVDVLRAAGARFAYLFGSRVAGTPRPDSDFDVAAFFGRPVDVLELQAQLGPRFDLLVLDDAPLALTGRVAMHGRLLFETEPGERVEWEATTRKIYLDELPRMRQAAQDFKAGALRRGGR